MKVPLLFFADYAEAGRDGRFTIMGGHFSTVTGPALPIHVARLSLGVRIEFEASEFGREHLVEIVSVGPSGNEATKPFALSFTPAPNPAEPLVTRLEFVYHMGNLALPDEGKYHFHVTVNSLRIANHFLAARLSPPGGTRAPWLTDLNLGFEAYARGEVDLAIEIYDRLAHEYPGVADVRNNHGFLLLQAGQAGAALTEFEAADGLRYSRRELTEANIACCLYLAGDHAAALQRFASAERDGVYMSGHAFLFALGKDGLEAVSLESHADYAALMDLNCGWCALRVGATDLAARHLARIEASDLALRDQAAMRSADQLRAELDAEN